MSRMFKLICAIFPACFGNAQAGVKVCSLPTEDAAGAAAICTEERHDAADAQASDATLAMDGYRGEEQHGQPFELTARQRVLVRSTLLEMPDLPQHDGFGVMAGTSIYREGRLHHVAVCGFANPPASESTRAAQRSGQLFYGWLIPANDSTWTFSPLRPNPSEQGQASIARLCARDGVSS